MLCILSRMPPRDPITTCNLQYTNIKGQPESLSGMGDRTEEGLERM